VSANHKLQLLIDRLRSFGIQVTHEPGASSATGELLLSATAFPTLGRPIGLHRARFYTLGHKHLKFFQPRVLFDLRAVEVSSCSSLAELESCLRRAWSASQRELCAARDELAPRGIDVRPEVQGTRLRLNLGGDIEGDVEIRSSSEFLLPSAGPLADVALGAPRDRIFRPLAGMDPAELELSIAAEMTSLARAAHQSIRVSGPPLPLEEAQEQKNEHRVLLVAHAGNLRDELIAQLPPREILPDVPRDPTRALDAFRRHSYELVLIEAQMPRIDGFELAMRMRSVPGIDRLPIVLLEERGRDTSRQAAEAAGASAYLPGPFEWDDMIATFDDMLDHAGERRFSRFPTRLDVLSSEGGATRHDLTESIARGGLTLRTQREVELGRAEVFRVSLPPPLGAVDIVGQIVSRMNLPGYASVLAGVRLLRFQGDGEARWIRLIETLAGSETE